MVLTILIYSSDATRGRILSKALQHEDVKTILCRTHTAIKKALRIRQPDVLIFDTKHDFWDELKTLKALSHYLPTTRKLILGEPKNLTHIETAPVMNCQFVPDPLDPDLCIATVRDILSAKKKILSVAA